MKIYCLKNKNKKTKNNIQEKRKKIKIVSEIRLTDIFLHFCTSFGFMFILL